MTVLSDVTVQTEVTIDDIQIGNPGVPLTDDLKKL